MMFYVKCGGILPLLLMTVISLEDTRQVDLLMNNSSLSDHRCHGIWSVRVNGTCQCGSDLSGVVYCDPQSREVEVRYCHCLTESEEFSVAGACYFNCRYNDGRIRDYTKAPTECASLNRKGTLCGQCIDGYTLPAYSYDFKCIKCDNQNWGLYITFAFLPLTVFIIIILVFRINVLSPKIFLYVYSAKVLSMSIACKAILNYLSTGSHSPMFTIYAKALLSLYGIWNLDFVRVNVLPDICIDATPLQILILDYLVAIYPMMMMAIAYTMVEIHSFGSDLILCIWRPFHRFLARFRRHCGIQTTILDAFVTFFFLSTTKLTSVSFSILSSTKLYKNDGKIDSRRLYYDPSITFLSKEHLPYAVMATIILIVFIVFPLSLLFCYQCRFCKKCLTVCNIRRETLDQFVNTFQMYYKDGTNGTHDCRWFAGVFIILKLIGMNVAFAIFSGAEVQTEISMLFILGAVLVIIVEPYKEEFSFYNSASSACLLFMSLLYISIGYENLANLHEPQLSSKFGLSAILGTIPLVYIIIMLLLYVKNRFGKKTSELINSLPHRLLHSEQYRLPLSQQYPIL